VFNNQPIVTSQVAVVIYSSFNCFASLSKAVKAQTMVNSALSMDDILILKTFYTASDPVNLL